MINVTCAIIILVIKLAAQNEKKKLPLKWNFQAEKWSNEECIVRKLKKINVEIEIVKKIIYDYGAFKINLIPFIAYMEIKL
jgi:8-oxo-dGTP diphosphatase